MVLARSGGVDGHGLRLVAALATPHIRNGGRRWASSPLQLVEVRAFCRAQCVRYLASAQREPAQVVFRFALDFTLTPDEVKQLDRRW